MSTNTTALPFAYKVGIISPSAMKLDITSGVFRKRYLVNDNIANLMNYLLELFKMKFYAHFETTVVGRAAGGSNSGKLHIAIRESGSVDTHTGFYFTEPMFCFQHLQVPIIRYREFLMKFFQDVMLEMHEFSMTVGASNIKYVLPSVKYELANEVVKFTFTTPRETGTTSSIQDLTLVQGGLIGLVDLIDHVGNDGAVSDVMVEGPKFRNSIKGTGSDKGKVFTFSRDREEGLNEISLFLGTGMLPLFRKAIMELCTTHEEWTAATFAGETFHQSKIFAGCGTPGQCLKVPYQKKTAPVVSTIPNDELAIKFPMTIPPFMRGFGNTFHSWIEVNYWVYHNVAEVDRKTYCDVLAKLSSSR